MIALAVVGAIVLRIRSKPQVVHAVNASPEHTTKLIAISEPKPIAGAQGATNPVKTAKQFPPLNRSLIPESLLPLLPINQAPLSRRELLKLVGTNDLPQLHQLFTQLSLKDRDCMIGVLAFIGDETSIKLMTNALTVEFSGATFDSDDVMVLHGIFNSLGFLSAQYPEAYDFLRQGIETDFWRTHKKWTTEEAKESIDVVLAAASLQHMGFSGRPDFLQLLEDLKARESAFLYARSSVMVDAAFSCQVVQKYGKNIFLTRDSLQLFNEWSKEDDGKKWNRWANEVLNQKAREKAAQQK